MTLRFVLSVFVAANLAAGSVAAGTIDENKALVSKSIAADNSNDYENLPTYITEDFMRHSQASPNVVVTNRDQFVAHMRDSDEMFPDAIIDVQQIIAEGDRVAVWASYQGRAAGSGAVGPKIDIDVSMIFRVDGNKIAELWVMWDNNALRSQLNAQGATSNN